MKSLSVSNNPLVGLLVARFIENRDSLNYDYAKKLLDRFFIHYNEADELRTIGLNLIIELHTHFGPFNYKLTLSQFTESLLNETDCTTLSELIKNQVLELLFTSDKSDISISDMVKDYVIQYLDDETLTLKYIAENLLFINVNYLSRTFVKQTGEKFSCYLNRTRIEKAKKLLLLRDNLHVHEIADAVGFGNNPQYFSQVFKKYTGLTPTQYIESRN